MGYKEDFKRREMEHELGHEDEEMFRSMSLEEVRQYLRKEAEAEALRHRGLY